MKTILLSCLLLLATPALAEMAVSKSTSHKNLTVFPIHGPDRPGEYMTLDEGLERGLVQVSEMKNKEVGKLVIENKSDKPLFLQEGDRVKGGHQDRTIQSSLVIPPKSGKRLIPTFCVEQSRWSDNGHGRQFVKPESKALASSKVRFATKISKNQGKVWSEVAKTKSKVEQKLGTGNTNSSLMETVDSKEVEKATKEYEQKLAQSLDQDAVGYAIAIDGEIVEVNVFDNKILAAKTYPRVLKSYAMEAAVSDKQVTKSYSGYAVQQFVSQKLEAKPFSEDTLDKDNKLTIVASEKREKALPSAYKMVTNYRGNDVHTQWVRNPDLMD